MRVSRERRAEFLLASISLIWGATFVLVKAALAEISPMLFLAIRFALAAAVLIVVFRRKVARGFTAVQVRAGVVTGLFLVAGYILQTIGLKHTTASKSAFITALYIVLVPFLGIAVYKKGPTWREIAGVAAAGLGVSLMALPEGALRIEWGDLLTILCAVAFAGHILAIGHYAEAVGFESLSVLQVAVSCLAAAALVGWFEAPELRWTPVVVAAILVSGLFSTALAFALQSWAQQFTSATRAAIIFSLEPVFAGLTAYFAAGEVFTARSGGGAAMILGGILLVEMKPAARTGHLNK